MEIRNFCIIAHIDHGKSTLADRFLEVTGTVQQREMKSQLLDQMDLEREKGITIKLQPVRMKYTSKVGKEYILNLIDTPGHVDFGYEVSRSLAACEGAVLLVDASQGMQAQTLANLYLAIDQGLDIIPVLNKIDLPSADPERVAAEICSVLGCTTDEILKVSGKTGEGVPELIEHLLDTVPPPKPAAQPQLRALLFDSLYDSFQGVLGYIRVMDGDVKKGDKVRMMSTGELFEVQDVGVFLPQRKTVEKLSAGEVGYIVTGHKSVGECPVGDTVCAAKFSGSALAGYKPAQPMVFASFYPVDAADYDLLRYSLDRLSLNDAALSYTLEQSLSLGRGVRIGFLGMLHMEIVHERLKREHSVELIVTIPSVIYQVVMTDGSIVRLTNPSEMPDQSLVGHVEEPFVRLELVCPQDYLGGVMELCGKYRGVYENTEYLDQTRAVLHYSMPLSSVVSDFYDKLQGVSSGYASLSYELRGYQRSDLVKMDILIAAEPVSAFARIIARDEAMSEGRRMVKKLKDLLPRQNFEVPIQAAIGSKILSRETLKAFRKDVTAGLYGGDVSRKRKVLQKQKKGKKRMKHVGSVPIPQEVFLSMMKK